MWATVPGGAGADAGPPPLLWEMDDLLQLVQKLLRILSSCYIYVYLYIYIYIYIYCFEAASQCGGGRHAAKMRT